MTERCVVNIVYILYCSAIRSMDLFYWISTYIIIILLLVIELKNAVEHWSRKKEKIKKESEL